MRLLGKSLGQARILQNMRGKKKEMATKRSFCKLEIEGEFRGRRTELSNS